MIEDFLHAMRAEGLLDSAGQFTLNAAQARQKLQHYQFKAPHEYVLAVYRCAVLSGASRFECTNDADDCILEFDGRPLATEDFHMLWGTLFMRQDDLALARLRYLALGLNAALGMEPAFVTLESFGWQVTFKGQEETAGPARGGERTRIHVHQRAGWKTAQRFVQKLRDLPPEGATLRAGTRYGGVPVRINGKSYQDLPSQSRHCLAQARVTPRDSRYRLPEFPRESVPTLELEADFAAVLNLMDEPGDLEYVVAGVSAGRRPFLPDVGGIVSTPDLMLDASQSEIVADERWEALAPKLFKLREQLIGHLARAYPDSNSAQAEAFLWMAARHLYATHTHPAAAGPHLAALADVPLVHMQDGSFETFAQIAARGPVARYSTRQWDLPRELVQGILWCPVEPGLKELFSGVALKNADEELEKLRQGHQRRLLWEAQTPHPVRLPPDLARLPLEGPGLEGEAALDQVASILVYKGGRLLHELDLPTVPAGLTVAVNHDGLEMDPTWSELLVNDALCEVKQAVYRVVPRLFAQLDKTAPPSLVRDFLEFHGAHPETGPWPPEGGVAEVPAFPSTDQPLSLNDLEKARKAWTHLYYLLDGKPTIPEVPGLAPVRFPVLCLTKAEVARLVKVLPSNTLQLAREHPEVLRRLNYSRFLKRPAGTGMSGPFLAERRLGEHGRLAVPQVSVTQGLEVWLTFEGRQVCRLALDWPFGPVAVEVPVPPQVEIDGEWNGILPSDEWDGWLEDLLDDTRELGAELAERLEKVADRDLSRAIRFLLQQLSFECKRCRARMEEPESDPVAGRLLRARIFTDLAGARHSAHELLHSTPRVGYVEKARRLPAGLTETVLLLTGDELTMAHDIFGPSRVVNRTRHLASLDTPGEAVIPLPEGDFILQLQVPGARLGILRDPRRPGEVLLCSAGQVVERVQSPGDIPHCGVFDHPAFQADGNWTRVIREALFHRVLREVQEALLGTVERWLQEGSELGYLVELLRSLYPLNPLREQWGSRAVLQGWRDPVTLVELERRLRVAGPPEYLRGEVAAELRAAVPQGEWSRLTRDLKHTNPVVAPAGWHSAILGKDVSARMQETARELEFERGRRLELDLEAHWPGVAWLARGEVAPVDGLKDGQLGLLAKWEGEGGILVAHKGVHVGELDLGLGLALRGCVTGHFPPGEGGLRDPKAGLQLLLPAAVEFLRDLARNENVAEELRAVVLLRAWQGMVAPYRAALDSVRCLPLEGGRRAELGMLLGLGRLLWVAEGETGQQPDDGRPRRGDEQVLELRPGSRLLADLEAVLHSRLVRLLPEEKPADAETRPEAAAPPAEEAQVQKVWEPEAPEEQLLARLRSEFRLLGVAVPESYLDGLHLAPEASGLLCWFDERGLALNNRHPAVLRTLQPNSPPRHLYLLLSSLFSVVNRTDESVTDLQEREFHNAILETLSGARGS